MNRYTIERIRKTEQVYSIELYAESEEQARLKAKEYIGEIVESNLLSDRLVIISTETMETEE